MVIAGGRKLSESSPINDHFPTRQIGELLKDKFENAHEVQQRKRRGRRMLLSRFSRFKPHTDTDLVFLRHSPDYCEMDLKRGSLGTHGRECDPVSGKDACSPFVFPSIDRIRAANQGNPN